MRRVEVESAIRTRRTHKAYAAEPVPREHVQELLELALAEGDEATGADIETSANELEKELEAAGKKR